MAVRLAAFLAVCAMAATTACADGRPDLVVSAAASLTEVIHDLAGDAWTVNVGGSQQLARQIRDGAPVDVFLTADPELLAGLPIEGSPVPFATNQLAIAVPPGNPLEIRTLDDLADRQLRLVLAAPEVPAGRYARDALAEAGVTVEPDSLELDVRQVVAKVDLGEADAGIVYTSDLQAADVDGVPIDTPVEATYVAAVIAGADPAAHELVEHLRSGHARSILIRHGLRPR